MMQSERSILLWIGLPRPIEMSRNSFEIQRLGRLDAPQLLQEQSNGWSVSILQCIRADRRCILSIDLSFRSSFTIIDGDTCDKNC
jgi:hypothetical protein